MRSDLACNGQLGQQQCAGSGKGAQPATGGTAEAAGFARRQRFSTASLPTVAPVIASYACRSVAARLIGDAEPWRDDADSRRRYQVRPGPAPARAEGAVSSVAIQIFKQLPRVPLW